MKYSGAMRICVGTDVAIVTALICIEAFNIGGKTRAALCIGAIVSYILSQRMASRRYERCGVQSENVSGFLPQSKLFFCGTAGSGPVLFRWLFLFCCRC